MSQRELTYQLHQVARRLRKLRLWSNLTCTWLALFALLLVFLYWRPSDESQDTVLAVCISAVVFATGIAWWRSTRFAQDPRWIAQQIEAHYPSLDARLAAAVQQQPPAGARRFGFLQEAVIRQALLHQRDYDWKRLVSADRLFFMRVAGLVALALLVTSLVSVSQGIGRVSWISSWSGWGPSQITVEPGDTEVERGTSLLVLARFTDRMPNDAELEVTVGDHAAERLPMKRSLDDPVFAGRLQSVTNELMYHVEYDGQWSDSFHVKVFDYPRLERLDAAIHFPDYAGRPDKLVEDTRRVTALEGSRITIICRLNKSVATADLVDRGETLALSADAEDPLKYTVSFTVKESRRFKVRLKDADGRENRVPPELVVRVIKNASPTIQVTQPGRDAQVSPLEELDVSAKIGDDVKVSKQGVSFTFKDAEEVELPLGGEDANVGHRFDFEALGAAPDELLSYYFWAEDLDADGNVRRTRSDIYFAEVRPFEEIFREADGGGQQQQQGGAGQEAQQLAELQKQIIAATWKVLHSSTADEADEFSKDVTTVKESQQMAVQQATDLMQQLQDEQSRTHLNEAIASMGDALEQLTAAAEGGGREALASALPPEKLAYQSLLKLRAREHNVSRSQSGQGQGQASSPNQRQLDQLKLKNDPRQYENQTTAQDSQEKPADRENRQVLNRLRELARRQEDINERLKQLQTELQQARTDEERQELEKQLKRLREEEEQILRDTEEAQQRVAESQDPQTRQETGEQLESTRERIRQTTEALRDGQVGQATAEGTRAAREFQELRDEFRRRASGQFAEDAEKLRDAAKELQERQKKLGERLEQQNSGEDRTLRGDGSLGKDFEEQSQQLEKLLSDMQDLVEQSESSEPLLAKELYDAFREAQQRQVNELLKNAGEMVRLGFPSEAGEAEQRARQGISDLAKRVGKAAQSVLGDETEALRRAQDTLRGLSEDMEKELAENDPQPQQNQPQQDQSQPNQGQGQQSGEQQSQQQGQQEGKGQQQGREQEQQGQHPGQGQESGRQQGQQQGGQQPGGQRGQQAQNGGQQGSADEQADAKRSSSGGGTGGPVPADRQDAPDLGSLFSGGGNPGVITGNEFRDWSDRMRDVEEMVGDGDLRAEAAAIRQRVRQARAEFKRHSVTPDWNSVRDIIAKPLANLEMRINEELLVRQSKQALAPIDRDPVPTEYSDEVREYYEQLGTGK